MEDPFSVTPIVVQMVNGVPVLRQGACRIRSIAIANRQLEAEGRERITRIRCEEFRGSASKAEPRESPAAEIILKISIS